MLIDTIRDILDRSLPLGELIRAELPISPAHIDLWMRQVERGDTGFFLNRLSWDSLAPCDFRGRSPTGSASIDASWHQTFSHLIAASNALPGTEVHARGQLHDAPFEAFFAPLIEVARQRLLSRLGGTALVEHITEDALAGFEQHLLASLQKLAIHTLRKECQIFAALRQPLAKFSQCSSGEDLEREFLSATHSRLERICRDYPVLARLLSIVIERWVENTATVIIRFATDRVKLACVLNQGEPLGRLSRATAGLSDFHRGNQTVCRLECESGLTVIYKPRDTRLEEAFSHFVAWLNQHNCPVQLCAPAVLSRDGYGWSEYIPAQPPECLTTLAERCGALLFVMHLLDGTDAHHENVVISGNDPVLVDGETLFSPRASTEFDVFNRQLTRSLYWKSALKCGFLPEWTSEANGRSYDLSIFSQHSAFRSLVLGEDCGDVQEHLADRVRSIIRGFERLYHFVRGNKRQILSDGGPLESFPRLPVRFIFRPTAKYVSLLSRCCYPEFLLSGLARSIEVEVLSRTFRTCERRPRLWNILKDEINQLEDYDVPYFYASTSDTDLPTSHGIIEDAFEQSGYDHVRSNVNGLSNEDLAFQKRVVQGSFDAFTAVQIHTSDETMDAHVDRADYDEMSNQAMVAKAVEIGDLLVRHAISGEDGQVTWLGLAPLSNTDRHLLQPLNCDLYSGTSGVALFLAVLYRVTGKSSYAECSLGAMRWLRQCLDDQSAFREFVRQMRPGMADGIGGIIYALAHIGRLLDSHRELDTANAIARYAAPSVLHCDGGFGILSGAAGACLAMLTLHDVTGDSTPMRIADEFASFLCDNAEVETGNGYRIWNDPIARKPITGFGHGAAGIAYSLLRIYDRNGDQRYLAFGEEALKYENSLYCERTNAWPDFRIFHGSKPAGPMVAWCHGPAGIGMARAATLNVLDSQAVRRDIDSAIRAITKRGIGNADYLCCGNMGRLLILDDLSRRLSRPELGVWVRDQATQLNFTASRSGYRLPSRVRNAYCPGLFQGLSGIGYGFLKLATPDSIPSLLELR